VSGNPLVSVLLPAKDEEATLPRSLGSLLRQTYQDFEILVIDDGSRDRTRDVALGFGDDRIRVLRNKSSRGIALSLNAAAHEARGRYLARHDAGDISTPERLALQVAFLQANANVGVVSGAFEYEQPDGSVRLVQPPTSHDEIITTARRDRCVPICHAAAMIRPETLRAVKGYRAFPVGQDQDLWWRIGEVARLANLSESLYHVAFFARGVSVRRRRLQFWVGEAIQRLVELREMGAPDPLGYNPNQEQIERFVNEVQARASESTRGELREKLLNHGFHAWRRGNRRVAAELHQQFLAEGGRKRRLLRTYAGVLRSWARRRLQGGERS
jgi:glycosyltransferase involved in cell wall biosynthesis